jgi:hypothetical protein
MLQQVAGVVYCEFAPRQLQVDSDLSHTGVDVAAGFVRQAQTPLLARRPLFAGPTNIRDQREGGREVVAVYALLFSEAAGRLHRGAYLGAFQA